MPSHLSGQAPRSELRRRVVEDPVGAAHEIDHLYTALADVRGELKCREQEIKALLEPLRKLVEGRANPTAAARGWHSEFSDAGQRTVWLTRDEWENYRDLLEAMTADEEEARDAA